MDAVDITDATSPNDNATRDMASRQTTPGWHRFARFLRPRTGPHLRLPRRGHVVAALAASIGLVGALGMTTASATSLEQYPTFGCFKTATGAVIQGDELKVNLDGKTTLYFAEVYRWNGAWVDWGHLFNSRGGAYVSFQDTPIGELSEDVLTGNVTHGYYQVVYYMESSGDNGFQKTNALDLDAPSTRYNNFTCIV